MRQEKNPNKNSVRPDTQTQELRICNICETKPARPGGLVCYACHKRKCRAADPVKSFYTTLYWNAQRRKKEFTITLEYFRQWVIDENFIVGSGRGPEADTVDRKENHLGYIPGNLQKLSKSVNSSKKDRDLDEWKGINIDVEF
jgi:hypothetical protein